jgi:U2-associated protein SR140
VFQSWVHSDVNNANNNCEIAFEFSLFLSGDLYSVKIMWPRTAEERSRNRNTGFVCFMSRKDAEDAVDAYCDADVFGNGRRIVLRWGKNVKKTVKFGAGVPSNMRKKPRASNEAGNTTDKEAYDVQTETKQSTAYSLEQNKAKATQLSASLKSDTPVYDPVKHSADAIVVIAPADVLRLKFISTIASFVAKDGSVLEQKLIEAESSNPHFQFLSHGDGDEVRMAEHIFYRWRVYSFCQGDGENIWRTEPFVMFEPLGRWWIPPPLNAEAARMEEEAAKRREKDRVAAQEERRRLAQKKEFTERARFSRGELKLNNWERETFTDLLRKKLCASQESICDAMSFAFEKSGAAREISEMLKESLLEQDGGISADTRIARLFLLSDILFNSQQPGVKNAFFYRDSIEKMSPEIFASLGRHGNGRAGRMTMAKLRKAVSSVLSAWVNWSVFDSSYIDDLESKFEGRKIAVARVIQEEEEKVNQSREVESSDTVKVADIEIQEAKASTIPKGAGFVAIADQDENIDLNGAEVGEDLDGEPLDEDLDGESLSEGDLDGEPLSDEDLDGEALDDDEILDTDVDGSRQ